MMMWVFLFTLILPNIWACPAPEKLHPCTCEDLQGRYSIGVTCGVLETYQVIGRAVESLRGRRDVYSFTIEDSILSFIPGDAFRGLQFKMLEIKRSKLQALTDMEVAFSGLEDSLETLWMSEFTLMSDWDWSILKNLKKLDTLHFTEGNIKLIDDGLEQMSADTLKTINFNINQIIYLGENVFASFTNLKMLTLDYNEIKEVKRSMLPNPAPALGLIGLGYNQLQKLPEDFFTNMPNLKIVGLPNNKILFLDEKVFKPIWHQLEHFTILDNELRCDCRMAWILEQKFPKDTSGACANPPSVRGRNINSLATRDLFCFVKK